MHHHQTEKSKPSSWEAIAMNRRTILTGAAASAAGLLTWGGLHAQQAGKVYRVGVLLNRNNPSPETESLRTGLTQLGYFEGTNVVYEVRAAEGQLDRLPGFAVELVSRGVDVIVSYGGPPTNAARKATTTIPIVFTLVADQVAIGAAATLERPGGNLTGVTNNDPELPVRHMALLKEMIPKLARVAIFSDADIPGADANGLAPIDRANVAAASAAGLKPQVLKLRGPKPDFDAAFKAMANEGAEALVVLEVPAVFAISKTVAELATARRIPTMLWGGQADAGGLMSYGTSYTSTYPRVPVYVDRILKGAKPADTAIEVFSKHQLVINLKTARELGVTVPAEMLKHADRVIE
jgi:putative tryptophan/tyrosine transport system substrate-binding protein